MVGQAAITLTAKAQDQQGTDLSNAIIWKN
jgi:hypothetical protein